MHDQFNLLKASYALQHCTPNQLYFKDSCFQPLIFWKAMTDVQLVIFLNRQMNAEWHRLFESITLFPCNTGSGLFMQKARGGEIYSLSKETIVLYLNIERPIVPLSGSQCLWHFSGMKPSWCVRVFFCSILFFFFLESYDKGYPFIWREINETVKRVCVLPSFHLLWVVTVYIYRVCYTSALFFFNMNILVSWIKSCF